MTALLFTSMRYTACVGLLFAAASFAHAAAKPVDGKHAKNTYPVFPANTSKSDKPDIPENWVIDLLHTMKVENISHYDLRARLKERLERRSIDIKNLSEEDKLRIAKDFYAPHSIPILADTFGALTKPQYPNALIKGLPGVGKTHLLMQLAVFLSLGIIPDELHDALGLDNPNSPVHIDLKNFADANVIFVNEKLLSHTQKSKDPTEDTESRRRRTVEALFAAAEKQAKRLDHPSRTIFVFDEAATLKEETLRVLKSLQDEGGYVPREADAASLRATDPGTHTILMTTIDEYDRLTKGDSAYDRRYTVLIHHEMPPEAMLEVLRKEAFNWAFGQRDINVDEDALRYLVQMRRVLDWPPTAAPGSILKAFNEMISWKTRSPGADPTVLTRKDAQTWLIKSIGLTDVWLEGPNGEPPFHNLAERVKEFVVDHDDIVDQIAHRIKMWARTDFGGKIPIFFLAGPTGSGKDTLFKAFNHVMYGVPLDDNQFIFNFSGKDGYAVDDAVGSPPQGNHSDDRMGLIIKTLSPVRGRAAIAINEAGEFSEFDKFKVPLENGAWQPQGVDTRPRPILGPVFFLGQWGESNILKDLSVEEQRVLIDGLTPKNIAMIMAAGNPLEDGTFVGRVPKALSDRALAEGGLFYLRPASRAAYPKIAQTFVPALRRKIATDMGLKLGLDPKLFELASAAVWAETETSQQLRDIFARENMELSQPMGPRGLRSAFNDLTRGFLSQAMDHGIMLQNLDFTIEADGENPYTATVSLKNSAGEIVFQRPARQLIQVFGSCASRFTN